MSLVCFSLIVLEAVGWPSVHHLEGISIEPATIDMGIVGQGDHEVSAKVLNRARESIVLKSKPPSCGCLTPKLAKLNLAPGEEGELSATWDTRGIRGDALVRVILGYHLANRPDKETTIALSVRASVEPLFDYVPNVLRFERGIETEREIVFHSSRLKDFRIQGVRCRHPAFEAEMEKDADRVRVHFRSDAWRGFRGPIDLVVETNCPEEPTVSIPIVVGG